jgi:hypothetical protein
MTAYACDSCKMSIEAPVCGNCHQELIHKTIDANGKKVAICECPKGCGCIKSPQCCGHDMAAKKSSGK